MGKEQLKQKLSNSILDKKKSSEISSLVHNKNFDEKEKEFFKYLNNSMRRSNKSKHKNKEKEKSKNKSKEKEKEKINDKEKDKINNKEKAKEKKKDNEKDKNKENDKFNDKNNNQEIIWNDFNKKESDNIIIETKMEKKELIDNENKMETNNNTEKQLQKKGINLKNFGAVL